MPVLCPGTSVALYMQPTTSHPSSACQGWDSDPAGCCCTQTKAVRIKESSVFACIIGHGLSAFRVQSRHLGSPLSSPTASPQVHGSLSGFAHSSPISKATANPSLQSFKLSADKPLLKLLACKPCAGRELGSEAPGFVTPPGCSPLPASIRDLLGSVMCSVQICGLLIA